MASGNWKAEQKARMQFLYGDVVEEWEKHPTDNRGVYAKTYRQIMEALEQVPDEPAPLLRVAMNRQMRLDCELMDRIREIWR